MSLTSLLLSTEVRHDEAGGDLVEVQRLDRGTLKLRKATKTSEGFLIADAVVARAGVYPYFIRRADGSVKRVLELVDDDVLKKDVADLDRLSLTLRHPKRDKKNPSGFVTAKNAKDLVTGDLTDVRYEQVVGKSGFAAAAICIRREDAVQAAEDGSAVELSCGYTAKVEKKGGVHPVYGRYDQRQVSRDYNHVAQVPRGRHGPGAALRLDAADLQGEDATVSQAIADALADVPVEVGAQLITPSTRRDDGTPTASEPAAAPAEEEEGAPKSDSTPSSREDCMDPTLLALAMALDVVKTDGMSDDAHKSAIVEATHRLKRKANASDEAVAKLKADAAETESTLTKAKTDAEAALATAEQAKTDAEAARADADGAMKAAMDMFKEHLKDEDGFKEDMDFKAAAALFGKKFGAMKKAKADAEDAKERARLDAIATKHKLAVADDVKAGDIDAYQRAVADAFEDGLDEGATAADILATLRLAERRDAAAGKTHKPLKKPTQQDRNRLGKDEVRVDEEDEEFFSPGRANRERARTGGK